MSTRSEQSRLNGAKSKGPKTDSGKFASSKNAIKHGLTSSILSIREDAAEFAATLAAWTDQLQPGTEAETRLVHRIASSEFRLERIVLIEANLLDAEIDSRQDVLKITWPDIDHAGLMALSFRDANRDSSPFELLRRYEAMLDRSIARNVRLLMDLQEQRRRQQEPEPENPSLPNEPEKEVEDEPGVAQALLTAAPPLPVTLGNDCESLRE